MLVAYYNLPEYLLLTTTYQYYSLELWWTFSCDRYQNVAFQWLGCVIRILTVERATRLMSPATVVIIKYMHITVGHPLSPHFSSHWDWKTILANSPYMYVYIISWLLVNLFPLFTMQVSGTKYWWTYTVILNELNFHVAVPVVSLINCPVKKAWYSNSMK
jgi:hypothetical protein